MPWLGVMGMVGAAAAAAAEEGRREHPAAAQRRKIERFCEMMQGAWVASAVIRSSQEDVSGIWPQNIRSL
jgi:hypothetical protein